MFAWLGLICFFVPLIISIVSGNKAYCNRYCGRGIVSLLYLVLGFFNIMFAWLGLICFFVPLIISIVSGNKAYCNRYCGRGQLFGILGGKLGLSRKKDVPKFLKSKWFRYGFLAFFFEE